MHWYHPVHMISHWVYQLYQPVFGYKTRNLSQSWQSWWESWNICNVWMMLWCTLSTHGGKWWIYTRYLVINNATVDRIFSITKNDKWLKISMWPILVVFVIRVWIRRLILPANEFWQLENKSFITCVCCQQDSILPFEPLIRNLASEEWRMRPASPAVPAPSQHLQSSVPRSEEELGQVDWLVSDPLLSCFRLPPNY